MCAPHAATGGFTPLPPSTRVAPARVTCPDRPNQGNRGHHQNRTTQRQRKQRTRYLCNPRAGYGTQQAAQIVAHRSARQQGHGGQWFGKRGIQSSNCIAVQGSQMDGFVAPVVGMGEPGTPTGAVQVGAFPRKSRRVVPAYGAVWPTQLHSVKGHTAACHQTKASARAVAQTTRPCVQPRNYRGNTP